jgi:hypothetical protein
MKNVEISINLLMVICARVSEMKANKSSSVLLPSVHSSLAIIVVVVVM